MDPQLAVSADHAAAVVWLDRRHALVARAQEGHSIVSEVERDTDLEPDYLLRVVHAAADCERVVVMGPDAARIDFEREYVALYRRPDRLIDVGYASQPARSELIEQLQLVEPARASH
ncbi:MAG TPA: hypothetical protein VHL56_09055 [Candidatus Limnocylindrales bacterium]|jgi:hypothetical protein|nr:hypothetical protein [Candidatus Limnocylindrales bacterium]